MAWWAEVEAREGYTYLLTMLVVVGDSWFSMVLCIDALHRYFQLKIVYFGWVRVCWQYLEGTRMFDSYTFSFLISKEFYFYPLSWPVILPVLPVSPISINIYLCVSNFNLVDLKLGHKTNPIGNNKIKDSV